MAITLTISNLNRNALGGTRLHTAKVVTAGTYLTNGFALAPGDLGLASFDQVRLTPVSGYTFEYLPSSGKVLAYVTNASTPTGAVTAVVTRPTFTLTTGTALAGGGVFVDTTGATAKLVGGTALDVTTAVVITSTLSPVQVQTVTATFAGTALGATLALSELTNGTALVITTYIEALGR